MLRLLFSLSFLIAVFATQAQNNPFSGYMPIQEAPSLQWLSPGEESEPMVFDAEPIIYYYVYNSYREDSLAKGDVKPEGIYLNFISNFRMYQGKSTPIKTPSYKAIVGWQRSQGIGTPTVFTYMLETGHYSNGQSRCAWSDTSLDRSLGCNKLYQGINDHTDLDVLLNRSSGNFTTNFSRFALKLELKGKEPSHYYQSFQMSYTYNHVAFAGIINYGGSVENDLSIIGDGEAKVEHEIALQGKEESMWSLRQSFGYLIDAHPSIEPIRYTAQLHYFPADWSTAFHLFYAFGHDNYNYRMVDEVSQIGFGLVWDLNRKRKF